MISQDEQNSKLEGSLKEADEERSRLQRTNTTQQTQIDKHKKLAEETKRKSDGLEGQLAALRKVVDSNNCHSTLTKLRLCLNTIFYLLLSLWRQNETAAAVTLTYLPTVFFPSLKLPKQQNALMFTQGLYISHTQKTAKKNVRQCLT